jgi:hypothetical protein
MFHNIPTRYLESVKRTGGACSAVGLRKKSRRSERGDVTVSRNVRVSTRNTQDVVSESWIAADPVDAHDLLACAMASSASAQRRSPVRITR